MDQSDLILMAVGDLELTRRGLILELQKRDDEIESLRRRIDELTGSESEFVIQTNDGK